MNEDFQKKLVDKGFTPYMANMLDQMRADLFARAGELSKLTGIEFSVNIDF